MVWTFLYGLVRAIRKKRAPNLWVIFTLGLFYGILIEILQFLLPTNRSPELYDFIADAFGSLLAIILLRILFSRLPDNHKT
jgi:VanZ family protein